MLEALINYWQPIGIDVTLLDSEWGTVRSNYRERTDFIKKGGWGNVITMRSLTNQAPQLVLRPGCWRRRLLLRHH